MIATPVLLIGLLLLVLIRQTRALIGRHRVQVRSTALRLVTATAFAALSLAGLISVPASALAGLGGLIAGGLLGWLALRLTVFEHTEMALFYRPNSYIGLGVVGLWVARLAIRLVALAPLLAGSVAAFSTGGGSQTAALTQLTSDPFTAAVTLVVWGFYAAYAAGLLLRSRQYTSHA